MYEEKHERDTLFSVTEKYTELRLLNDAPSGFGWAVLVRDNFENDRLKVIKLPNREAATRELLVEAEILAKIAQYLRHPNLIQLGSVECYKITWNDREEKRWFIVLQFGGNNLRRHLGRLGLRSVEGRQEYVYRGGKPLSLDEFFDIGLQIVDGLKALHEFEEVPGQHIIHRDIKPENILIDDRGVVRLTDFGISKIVERISQSITVAGTPPYLPPEYALGRISAASDIYSTGIVLYEMVTGRFPFRSPEDKFYTMPTPPTDVNPQTPAALSDIIMQALYWNPNAPRGEQARDRYHTAADMMNDLRRCYGRLHPVPPQFERISNEPGQQTIYRNKGTRQQVRIFLYDTDRPGQCLSRLAGTVHLDDHHFLTPDQTFDTEGMVGVVVPLLPKSAAAAIPTLVWEVEGVAHSAAGKPRSAVDGREQTHGTRCPEGEAAYQFVTRVITLCEQLKDLHRLGIYHGTVNPLNTWWYEDNWIIDQVWVGALIGLADPVSVFPEGDVSVGFLAPEILAWQSPPQLSSDIYGIGALLYGILTGTTPMDPSAARTLMRGGQPPPFRAGSAIRDAAPNVSRRLQDIIVKALQPDPARRHRTVDELANELAQCQWPRDMVLTLIERAHDYQKRGLIVEAYDALDEALRYEPGSPEVHHARAEIYFLEGEIVWALKENTKALEILPTASALFLQGQCLIAQKRYVEAQDCVRAGLDVEDCSRGHHLLAQCLEGSGLPLAAVSEYEEAVKHAELKKDDRLAEQIRSDLSALRSKIKDWHPDKP